MSTIKEIAAQLKITPTAVSYALNGRTDKISATTRERVLATARALGYQPHTAARALRTGRHQAVAVLIRTPQLPYYAEILHHLIQQVLAHPYQVIVQRAAPPEEEQTVTDPSQLSLPLAHTGVDGYFVVDAPKTAAILREGQVARPRPKAVIGLGVFHDGGGDHVMIDLAIGTRQAVAHLRKLGCRRMAYLIDGNTCVPNETRSMTYAAEMAQGGDTPEFLITPTQSRTAAYHFVRSYIGANGHPDGLLCVNDEMAMGAHRALWDLGLRVPQDVALIGCDGIPEAEFAQPPLTTIIQPVEEMARMAWQFLERRLASPLDPPQQALLNARLAIRASSGLPAED